MGAVPSQLDHLIYATPDLRASVADLERRLGVRFLPGGPHPAWGTRNALLPLGPGTYFEILGPDTETSSGRPPALFGIGRLSEARLVTWAAKGRDLAEVARRARARGLELGEVVRGSRSRPDGTRLAWELTDPFAPRAGGVVPFFIDWRGGDHPATLAPAEVRLVDLAAEHPSPVETAGLLQSLDIALEVRRGDSPALRATLRTPAGWVELA